MKYIIQIIAAVVGTAGFALIFRVNVRRIPYAVLGGGVTCGIYLLVCHFCPYEFVQLLIPSVFATAFSETFARILKTPASTLLLPTIISLVPGGSLYYSMSYMVSGDMEKFYETGYVTLEMAGGIAVGIILVSVIVNSLNSMRIKKTAVQDGGNV